MIAAPTQVVWAATAPSRGLPDDAAATVVSTVVEPLLHEMEAQDLHYHGCLYCGLMWTASGPRVLEFNVRCGDPETQAMVLSDRRDWLAMMAAQAGLEVAMPLQSVPPRASVAVVLTSPNYPFGSSNAEGQALLPRALFDNTDDDFAVFGAALQAADDMASTHDGRTSIDRCRRRKLVAYGKSTCLRESCSNQVVLD